MKISVYEKYWLLTALLVLVGFTLGVIAVETNSIIVVFCFFTWGLIASYILYQIKCPNCSTSLTYRGKLGGLPIFSAYPYRKCKNCGSDLRIRNS